MLFNAWPSAVDSYTSSSVLFHRLPSVFFHRMESVWYCCNVVLLSVRIVLYTDRLSFCCEITSD